MGGVRLESETRVGGRACGCEGCPYHHAAALAFRWYPRTPPQTTTTSYLRPLPVTSDRDDGDNKYARAHAQCPIIGRVFPLPVAVVVAVVVGWWQGGGVRVIVVVA